MAATQPYLFAELTAERLSAERVTATGTIKWIDLEGGRGMVGPDEGDDDLTFRFVDGSAPLRAGARVEFEVDLGSRRSRGVRRHLDVGASTGGVARSASALPAPTRRGHPRPPRSRPGLRRLDRARGTSSGSRAARAR